MISGAILVLLAVTYYLIAKSFHGEGVREGYAQGWEDALREVIRRDQEGTRRN